MVQEMRVRFDGPGHSPKYGIFHFEDAAPTDPVATAIMGFFNAIKGAIHTSYSVHVEPQVRLLNTVTGVLTGLSSVDPPSAVTGTATGQPVADASQALIRWHTGMIVSGRELRGRTFIPGLANSQLDSGNLAASSVTLFTTAGNARIAADSTSVIWSRKHGVVAPLTTADCWSEFAVQRGRRG